MQEPTSPADSEERKTLGRTDGLGGTLKKTARLLFTSAPFQNSSNSVAVRGVRTALLIYAWPVQYLLAEPQLFTYLDPTCFYGGPEPTAEMHQYAYAVPSSVAL